MTGRSPMPMIEKRIVIRFFMLKLFYPLKTEAGSRETIRRMAKAAPPREMNNVTKKNPAIMSGE